MADEKQPKKPEQQTEKIVIEKKHFFKTLFIIILSLLIGILGTLSFLYLTTQGFFGEQNNQTTQVDTTADTELLQEMEKQNEDLKNQNEDLKKEIEDLKDENEMQSMKQNEPLAPNMFDLSQAKIGDKVVGMTIKNLNLAEEDILPFGSSVAFTGETQITGKYMYYPKNTAFVEDSVCFSDLSSDSIAKMPQIIGISRSTSFCFRNVEKAQSEFGPEGSSGTATIKIDDYLLVTYEKEVWNTATLVDVISKN